MPKSLILVLFALLSVHPLAAQPATSQDWQRMYDACVAGATPVFEKRGFGPQFTLRVCACIRDELRKVNPSEMNAKYEEVQNGCIKSSFGSQFSLAETDWSQDAIAASRAECIQAPPIKVAPVSKNAFCSCIAENTARSIRRRDFLLLHSAIGAKGIGSLDAEETKIMTKAMEAINYCSIKILSR